MAEKIIDNRLNLLGDDLKAELKEGSKVRIAASYFTLFAFNELREELGKIDELKVIFNQPTYTKNDFIKDSGNQERREFFIPKKERESSLFGTDFEIRLRNKMSLKAIAKECANWVEQKVSFKSNTTIGNMQNFIAIEQMDGRKVSYSPTPAEFSASGLGYEKSNDMMCGTCKSDTPMLAEYYLKEFDEIFADSSKVEEVTEEVVQSMQSAYKENSPEFIYLNEKGETIQTHLQVKQILDTVRVASKGQTQPIQQVYTRFNKETDDGLKMEKYNKLLGDAISTIIEVKKQSDIASLLDGDIDVLKGTKIKGLDDFELIAFVVVK